MDKEIEEKFFRMLECDSKYLAYYGYTCIGGRSEDQDCMAQTDFMPNRIAFAVCDGMGGHAGGCVASTTAASALMNTLKDQPAIIPISQAIVTAVTAANTAVYEKAQAEPRLRGMGTTLTLLVIDEEAAYVTHIGDSRVYQLRNGKKRFRTFDHSLVFEQVAKGKLTEEEARVHPRSNVLSRALGVLPDVDVVVKKLDYKEGDRFILCCDGVWNSQPEPDIIKLFSSNSDLKETILSTRNFVEKIGNENGGHHDNHTMIGVDLKCSSRYRKSIIGMLRDLFKREKVNIK
ncbi:MAG: PP2C family protein-serine/threonine phosphatase [Muribaculaceae bacterium]